MKLALVGSKGSGKDFLTDLLVERKDYKRLAWADSLKEFCNTLYPNLKKYNTHEAKDVPVPESWNTDNETPRDIWERVSREKAQEDDRFFHKLSLNEINKILEKTDNLVVTDTRNDWEYNDLVKMGFTVIYITRPGKLTFQGYDERILKFYKNIELAYNNNTDGLDFINQVSYLENIKG